MNGNKVLLSWEEPRYALKQIKNQISWKDRVVPFGKLVGKFALGGLTIGVIIVMIASFRHGFNNVDYINSLLFFTAIGVVLGIVAGLTTLLDLSISPCVLIREKDISIISVNEGANIPYKEIQSCSIAKTRIEDREVFILEIKNWDGNESFIEIAPDIKADDIIEILKTKDVQIKPSLFYPA